MLRSVRKTAWVAISAAALAALAAVPAHADDSSVQLGLCNRGSDQATLIHVTGVNQSGATVTYGNDSIVTLDAGDCGQTTGWWWRKGTSVTVSWFEAGDKSGQCDIPSAVNGDTLTCDIS
jgi:hypothetical protein